MHLTRVREKYWKVYAICDESGRSDLLNWTNQNYSKHISRLFAIIRQVSDSIAGPTLLPDDISHEVDKKNKIFEFIAGDIRLFWFYSMHENKVIICNIPHIKKGKKANKNAIESAIAAKRKYLEDFTSGEIEYHTKGE